MTNQTPEAAKQTNEAEKEAQQSSQTIVTEPVKDEQQKSAVATDSKKGPEAEVKVEQKFDLKLPEGSYLAPDAVEKVIARAKESNLTPEQAQAELNKENDLVKTFVEGEKAKLAKEQSAWIESSKNDAEIGGENFAANAETAKRVIQRFGTDAFKKALNESGLGNHPELVRVFVRIGRAMTPDQLVHSSGNQTAPRSAADILYGETSNKEK